VVCGTLGKLIKTSLEKTGNNKISSIRLKNIMQYRIANKEYWEGIKEILIFRFIAI
jgi:hypothetical protein